MIGNDGAGRSKRWRELLASERDAAALYSRIAEAETGERRKIFEELAVVERRHAAHWEDKLRGAGQAVPPPGRPGLRTRLLAMAAGRLSSSAVLPLIERAERADAGMYDADPDAAPGMAADEHGHARTVAKLREGGRPSPRSQITRREPWHRGDRSGALRAGVFGVSDGLVSNTALVMGIAGSGSSHTVILLAGTAGLLAGSFSMAAGEYVSMASQREMYEREIALDTLTREELGLDPSGLGSPIYSAISSLLTFAAGALVVILPYLFGGGTAAFVGAIVLAAGALLGVGAGIGALNGRSPLRSGLRQLFVGGLAALVTFGVGHLIGASVS